MRTRLYIGVCDELATELQRRVGSATRDFFNSGPSDQIDPDQSFTRSDWIMESILIEDYFMDMLFGNLPADPEYYDELAALRSVFLKHYDLRELLDRGRVISFAIDGKGRYLAKEVM